jgi:branched-chain amino acid transport system permease protein
MYLVVLVFMMAAIWIFLRLKRIPLGRAWEALKEDEVAARAAGINPTTTKLAAFMLGAAFGGVGGVFFAGMEGFINPTSFTFIESAMILAMVVLGGMGSVAGVILATVGVTLLPELFREFGNYRMLVFGLAMVFIMVWRPEGLLRVTRRSIERPADAA